VTGIEDDNDVVSIKQISVGKQATKVGSSITM